LEILKENPTATWLSIAAQLETTIDEVMSAIQSLTASNYLTIADEVIAESTQRVATITPQGTNALQSAEPLEVTFKVAYRYVKAERLRVLIFYQLRANFVNAWSTNQRQGLGTAHRFNK
jgi:hypothetical protein